MSILAIPSAAIGAAALCVLAAGCGGRLRETRMGRAVGALSATDTRACAHLGVVRASVPPAYAATPRNVRAALRNRAVELGASHVGPATRGPDGVVTAAALRCSASALRRAAEARREALRRSLERGPAREVEDELGARIDGGIALTVSGGLGVLAGVGLMIGSIRCARRESAYGPGFPSLPSCGPDQGILMAGAATLVGGLLLLGPGLILTLTGVDDRAAHRRALRDGASTWLRLAPGPGGVTLAVEARF